jgi:hypothetical protein
MTLLPVRPQTLGLCGASLAVPGKGLGHEASPCWRGRSPWPPLAAQVFDTAPYSAEAMLTGRAGDEWELVTDNFA